jgi:hypothetical protein
MGSSKNGPVFVYANQTIRFVTLNIKPNKSTHPTHRGKEATRHIFEFIRTSLWY